MIPDDEGHYARQVADFLKIPIRFIAVDGLQAFERWDDPEMHCPEPVDDPFFAGLFTQFETIGAECRVALSGEGSDNLMHFQMWPLREKHGQESRMVESGKTNAPILGACALLLFLDYAGALREFSGRTRPSRCTPSGWPPILRED